MSDKRVASKPTHRAKRVLWIALATAVVAILTDQVTKWWALRTLADGGNRPLLGNFLSFQLVHNPGAAFSVGEGSTWVFSVLSLVVVVGIAYVLVSGRVRDTALAFILGLIGGGAVGNLIDRLTQPPSFGNGHVVDFIDYNGWFVGNVADIWIVGGAAALVIYLFVMGDSAAKGTSDVGD